MRWITIIIILGWGEVVSGANWYVDNQATGANNGTSWVNAWQGFDPINWSSISGGDTLFLSGGTDSTVYDSTLNVSTAGTEEKRVVITPSDEEGHNGKVVIQHGVKLKYNRNHITIDGKNKRLIVHQNDRHGIYVYLCTNITLKDIEVKGVGAEPYLHGIFINYFSYFIQVVGCHIHGVTGDGVNINSDTLAGNFDSDYRDVFLVESCKIDSCADDGIQIGSERVTVRNCFIRYVSRAFGGIDPLGGHPDGIQCPVNKKYFLIEGNTFESCMQGAFIEGTRGFVTICNNIFYDVPERLPENQTNRGILVSESASGAIGEVVIANNVFYNHQWGAIRLADVPTVEIIVRNNIFLNCNRVTVGGEEFLREDNITYTTPDAYIQDPAQVPDSGMKADPLFNDYNNYDFTLRDGSPATSAGTNLSEYFITDFNMEERPADGPWDIGLYQQYGSSIRSASVPERVPVDYRPLHGYYTITGQRIRPERRVPTGIYLAPDAVTGQLRTVIIVK